MLFLSLNHDKCEEILSKTKILNVVNKIHIFHIASLFFYAFLCIGTKTYSQSIVAGQTSGNHIYYFDIEDIYIYGHPNDPDGAYFNIDGGSWDLLFVAYYFVSGSGNSTRTDVTPFGNSAIATIDSIETWVEKFEYGDTIHFNLNWYPNVALFRHQMYDSTYGIFIGEGYMAFRITSPYEILGWFKLDVGDGDMLIKEYAFYSETFVGYFENEINHFNIKYRNPVTDEIHLTLESQRKNYQLKYKIVDLLGTEIENGHLSDGNNILNLRNVPPGMYVMQIVDQNGFSESYKVIKE